MGTSGRRSVRCTPGVRAFLQDRPPDRFGRHRYDPADFAWTYAGLDEEFRQYVGHYGVKTARGC